MKKLIKYLQNKLLKQKSLKLLNSNYIDLLEKVNERTFEKKEKLLGALFYIRYLEFISEVTYEEYLKLINEIQIPKKEEKK